MKRLKGTKMTTSNEARFTPAGLKIVNALVDACQQARMTLENPASNETHRRHAIREIKAALDMVVSAEGTAEDAH